jgi:2-amino-4-hydroxy-6-hydroxymethyldihydropteridine diphosphokinase
MSLPHEFYLGLGSNVGPEPNLAKAIARLAEHGEIKAFSSVWESHAVGSAGPNFLNLCIQFAARENEEDLKQQVLRPIEMGLGRARTGDQNAPRTIDLDILLADGEPVNPKRWAHAFVLVPLAELLPNLAHPLSGESLIAAAAAAQAETWIIRRPAVLDLIKPPTKT